MYFVLSEGETGRWSEGKEEQSKDFLDKNSKEFIKNSSAKEYLSLVEDFIRS